MHLRQITVHTAASRLGIYPPLFPSPSGDSCILLPPNGGTINAFVWNLGTRTLPPLFWTMMMAAFYLTTICTSFNNDKRSFVSVQKESYNNFWSPLMKTLDKSVKMLGLES